MLRLGALPYDLRPRMGKKPSILTPDDLVWCPRCLDFIKQEYFGVDKSRSNGLTSVCRRCRSKRLREIRGEDWAECSKCRSYLALVEFGKDSTRVNGHSVWCRKCRSRYNKRRKKCPKNMKPATAAPIEAVPASAVTPGNAITSA